MTKKFFLNKKGEGVSKPIFIIFLLAIALFVSSFLFSDYFSDFFLGEKSLDPEKENLEKEKETKDVKDSEVALNSITGRMEEIDRQTSSFLLEKDGQKREIFVTNQTRISKMILEPIPGKKEKKVSEKVLEFGDLNNDILIEVISPGLLKNAGSINAKIIRVLID